MTPDIYFESFHVVYPLLNVKGWIQSSSKAKDLFDNKNNDSPLAFSYFERDDLEIAGIAGTGLEINIPLSILFSNKCNSLCDILTIDGFGVGKSDEILFLSDLINSSYDFESVIQNPTLCKYPEKIRFLAALIKMTKHCTPIEKGMAATILIYKALEFGWLLSDVSDEINVEIENIIELLGQDYTGNGNRWYMCLLQAFVILKIKTGNFDDAYSIASRVKKSSFNFNYPSLSTNCLYLLFFCIFFESATGRRDLYDYLNISKKIYIIHVDRILDPGDHFNELLNSIVVFNVIDKIYCSVDRKAIVDILLPINFTKNWSLVKREMIDFLSQRSCNE